MPDRKRQISRYDSISMRSLSIVRFIETGSKRVAAGGWGPGDEESWLMRTDFQFHKMKRVLWMDGDDGLQQ